MKYESIIELINLYQGYEEQRSEKHEADVYEFALWLLHQRIRQEADRLLQTSPASAITEEFYPIELEVENQIATMFGKLYRYVRWYVKSAFGEDIDLTYEEFMFLATVFRMRNPTKTEVIQENMIEITTGSEIIRRLVSLGFLEETGNPEDKRSKLLSITPQGLDILFPAFEQMKKVGKVIVGHLDYSSQRQLLAFLLYLDDFHERINAPRKNLPIDEVIETLNPAIAGVEGESNK